MDITNILQNFDTHIAPQLRIIYGEGDAILQGQRDRYRYALNVYQATCGNQDVLLVRAPGRVDLMGSHTDYHQGYVLPMALDKDILIVAGRREDQQIVLHNTDPAFAMQTFALEKDIPCSDKGSWQNYVKASVQAFVRAYGLSALKGMNLVVDGRPPYGVPVAAGLSSSSALLVATAVAMKELFQISMESKQLLTFAAKPNGMWALAADLWIILPRFSTNKVMLCFWTADRSNKTEQKRSTPNISRCCLTIRSRCAIRTLKRKNPRRQNTIPGC